MNFAFTCTEGIGREFEWFDIVLPRLALEEDICAVVCCVRIIIGARGVFCLFEIWKKIGEGKLFCLRV